MNICYLCGRIKRTMLEFFTSRFGSNGFLNEHLWLGNLGHLFIVLSFTSSILAFAAYFAAEFSRADVVKEKSWRKIARVSFITHGSSVIGIFVLLFIMILNHWFEYHYAWRHSSTTLPLKYIISSFWEGQEGSFLLWQFWLVLLGFVGIKTLKGYENPVMGITALTQVFLGSMVLGIYLFGHKIGSNPFILLRDEMANAPVFQRPNYLEFIVDGNGLNPLLQNYWMTIHPPILFCGFASVTFPFAFAIASLLRKDWDGWAKPALPWALFCVGILGTGILMGGAWAYESLSFGGFWAWDPVENMSFVPWIMVVAGLHMLLVYRATKQSLISAYLFFILGFILVLYSTYLTRSGRLGDTSVHSFTDDGMEPQLLLYFSFFIVSSFTLLFIRIIKKQLPTVAKEEELASREFWMFIGTLILLLSAIQMIFTTSIPVWNLIFHDHYKLLKDKIAPPENVIAHYNSIQIWLGILVGLLTGVVQFLSYKLGRIPAAIKWAAYSFGVALVCSVLVALGMHINFTEQHIIESVGLKFPFISTYFLFLLAAMYALFGNLFYIAFVAKGNLMLLGGSLSHLGFGIFLLGVLISQGKKEVISINKSGINFGKEFKADEKMENVLLLIDSALVMGDYKVTYIGTKEEKPNNYYKVQYQRIDSSTGKLLEEFTLLPNAQLNPKMGLLANPDTKHYWTKDVFTHVSSVPDNTNLKDTTLINEISIGDSFFTKTSLVYVASLNPNPVLPNGFNKQGKLVVGANLIITDQQSKTYQAQPVFVIDMANNNAISSIPAEVTEQGMTLDLTKIDPQTKKLTLSVHEKEKAIDFIIMKAIVFPYINLVWLGGILTFLGAFISMYKRRKA